jgi:hypothetical protein
VWLYIVGALAGTAAVALAGGTLSRKITARRAAAWTEAAGQLGLRFEMTADASLLIHGEIGGVPIRIHEEQVVSRGWGDSPTNPKSNWTVLKHGPLTWLPRTAEISNARSTRRASSRLELVDTGDPTFDATVLARGVRGELLPLLDYDARKAILAGVGQGDLRIESSRITLRKLGLTTETDRLALLGRSVQAIAAGLDPEGRTPAEQLAKTVRREPVEGAREVALAELALRYPEDPATRRLATELARSGLADRRVMSLDLLGAAGIPVAEGVVRDPAGTDAARSRARAFLEQHGRSPGEREQGRLSVVETEDPSAEGRLSQVAQDGELALSED